MKNFDINWDMILSKFIVYSLLPIVLLWPTTAAVVASTESSIIEVQRLLNLANTSLVRGDFGASIESLDEAMNMVQELNEEEIIDNNNGNDVTDDIADGKGIDSDIGDGMVDDNVERSQECVENARPGEVCALS
jgi:hypothetical protein